MNMRLKKQQILNLNCSPKLFTTSAFVQSAKKTVNVREFTLSFFIRLQTGVIRFQSHCDNIFYADAESKRPVSK